MKRISILSSILFLYSAVCVGQSYSYSYPTPTMAWIEGIGYWNEEHYQVSDIVLGYYTVTGDTLIDGKSYRRVELTRTCVPVIHLELDENGKEYIRDKYVETYDGGLHFFMREDEGGNVYLYADDKDIFMGTSHNVLYDGISDSLSHRDLFLYNIRKSYEVGALQPMGKIFWETKHLFDWDNLWRVDSLRIVDATDKTMLDGRQYRTTQYGPDSLWTFVQGIGPLWYGPLSGVGAPSTTYRRVLYAYYLGGQPVYRYEGYLSAIEEYFPDILNTLIGSPSGVDVQSGTTHPPLPLFDLQGRCLIAAPKKGIYIQGRKKVLIQR